MALTGCLPTIDGIRFDSEESLKEYIAKTYGDKAINSIAIDSKEIRIQLDVENDTEVQRKNLPVQIVNILGVMNSNAYRKVHNAIGKNISNFTARYLSNDSTIASYVRSALLKSAITNRLAVSQVASNKRISLSVIKSKAINLIISSLNNHIKPLMDGNSYAQGTMIADVYEYKDGSVTVGYNKGDGIKRGLRPMLYRIDGKVVEADYDIHGNIIKTPLEKIEEFMVGKTVEEYQKRFDVLPAEVIMPYPYRNRFGLKPDWNIEQSRAFIKENYPAEVLDEFEKSLLVVSIRIPTSNGSLGFLGKIVEFVEDMGNTQIIPYEQNIMTGADQDIDMLHTYFYPVKKIKRKTVEQDENEQTIDELEQDEEKAGVVDDDKENISIKKLIYDGLVEFYSTADNVPLILSPVNMDELDDEVKIAEKEDKRRGNMYINTYDTGQVMHRVNQDGKSVGYFANMNTFFAKIFSLSSIGHIIHGNLVSIIDSSRSVRAQVMAFTDSLVNASTDNSKHNYLGRLHVNEYNVSLIAGLVSMGYDNRTILRIARNRMVKNAVMELRNQVKVMSDKPSRSVQKLHQYFYSIDNYSYDTYRNDFVEDFKRVFPNIDIDRYEDAMEYIAGMLVQETLSGEQFIQPDNPESVGIIYRMKNHLLYMASMIGDRITQFGMVAGIAKELPPESYALTALYHNIENTLGMPIHEFLQGKRYDIHEQVEFYRNRMETSGGKVNRMEINDFVSQEMMSRNPEITFDMYMLLESYPNFMESLKSLNILVSNTLPELFAVNHIAMKSKKVKDGWLNVYNMLRQENGITIPVHDDTIKDIEIAIDDYVIGKFISQLPDDKRIIRIGSNSYDMRLANDRMMFAARMTEVIDRLQESTTPSLSENNFLHSIIVEMRFGGTFPILNFDIQYDESPYSMMALKNTFDNLAREIYKMPDIRMNFRHCMTMYNMIIYGFKMSKGTFIDIVSDNELFNDYTMFEKRIKEMDDIEYVDFIKDLNDWLSITIPERVLVMSSEKNDNKYKFTYKRIGKFTTSKRKRMGSILLRDGMMVTTVTSNEINTAGTEGIRFIPYNQRVELNLNEYVRLKTTGRTDVRYYYNKYLPDGIRGVNQNREVTFMGVTNFGQPVMVKTKSEDGLKYRYATLILSDERYLENPEVSENDNPVCLI